MTLRVRLGKHEPYNDLLIDNQDAALLVHTWSAQRPNNGRLTYAQGTRLDNGKRKTAMLHRLVAANMLGRELMRNEIVDHVNGNGLDNRRANLRVCTFAENLRNQQRKIDFRSPYKGITWHTEGKKWQAAIGAEGKSYYLGLFVTAEEAAEAYNKAAKKYHGEFARLNRIGYPDRMLTDEDTQPIIIPKGWPY